MHALHTYVCMYVRMYSLCIRIYNGKEGIVRYPSLDDALAAILQGTDKLYLLAQEACCDQSPYWCAVDCVQCTATCVCFQEIKVL